LQHFLREVDLLRFTGDRTNGSRPPQAILLSGHVRGGLEGQQLAIRAGSLATNQQLVARPVRCALSMSSGRQPAEARDLLGLARGPAEVFASMRRAACRPQFKEFATDPLHQAVPTGAAARLQVQKRVFVRAGSDRGANDDATNSRGQRRWKRRRRAKHAQRTSKPTDPAIGSSISGAISRVRARAWLRRDHRLSAHIIAHEAQSCSL